MSSTGSGNGHTGGHDVSPPLQVEGPRFRWKRKHKSAWWQLQCENGRLRRSISKWSDVMDSEEQGRKRIFYEGDENWSGLQFRLRDRKQEELQGVYPSSDQPAFRYSDVSSSLQDLLEDVVSFQIISDISFSVRELIQHVLKMVKYPSQVVEHIQLGHFPLSFPDSFILDIVESVVQNLFHDIWAGKLIGLKSLILHGYRKMKSGIGEIAGAMASGQLPKLEKLSFSCIGADQGDCEAYAEAVISGNLIALKELDFEGCKIGDSGAKALARGFESGKLKNLAVLKLPCNSIGNEGMIALARSLEMGGFPYLNHLDVTRNPWSDKSVPSIAHAIQSGNLRSMTELRLVSSSYDRWSKEMVEVLLEAVLSHGAPRVSNVVLNWSDHLQLKLRYEKLLLRKDEHRRIMAELGEGVVPATVGKVYLCGDPEVGKTTLRKSLERNFLTSLFRRERRHRRVERTRGIDVSVVSDKSSHHEGSITLMLWDMAGQNEYHLIHNSFLPDLGNEEAEATTFLVVFKSDDIKTAREQLEYWFRFISSSVNKDVQISREVRVVVNRTDGDPQVVKDISKWQEMVDKEAKKFEGVLKLSSPLFVADVRQRKAVRALKHHLIESTALQLRNMKVPAICHFVQTHLGEWGKEERQFPVLSWDYFLQLVRREGGDWEEKTVEAAVKYLHQSGLIVYVDKHFPTEWGISYQRLVILDPNWFCRDTVGNMFVPSSMRRVGEDLLREKVDPYTGSISVSVVNEWLGKVVEGWNPPNFDKLMIILLWLGLCYLDREGNLFIPSLASEGSLDCNAYGQPRDAKHRECWDLRASRTEASGQGESCQWVMGYSLHHAKSEISLAPIALWHKFQVELAQTSAFNGREFGDSCFVAGKYFVSFRMNSMAVWIKVQADLERPKFEVVTVYVKPLHPAELDKVDMNVRKQTQVDLAHDLIDILMTLWVEVCPRIEYVERVVWPCQIFDFNPNLSYIRAENVEVAKLKKWVQVHGAGRVMNWMVGREPITEDQLLCTNDKKLLVQSIKQSISEGRDLMREAMNLYDDVLDEESNQAKTSTSQEVEMSCPTESTTEGDRLIHMKLGMMDKKLGAMDKKLDIIIEQGETVKIQLDNLMREKRNLVRKVGDVGRMFLEDRDSSCPKFIYLGTKSGSWMTFKMAISPSTTVLVHFACEAEYNSYGQHVVNGQAGIEVTELKPWAQKLLPWLRVSLTVLYVSAKLTANVLVPGMGLILPNCPQWQETSSLAEGLRSAIGYSKDELDEFMNGQVDFGAETNLQGMKELYGSSRLAMTELLGKLTSQEYEKKLGMRKVQLYYSDRSPHGVAWICNDCFQKFRAAGLVSEL